MMFLRGSCAAVCRGGLEFTEKVNMSNRVKASRTVDGVARLLALAGLGVASAQAGVQPVLILNGLSDDISSNGQKAAGLLFDADAGEYVAHTWTRGVGYTRIVGGGLSAEPIRGSNDLSVLATGKVNTTNWGDLNCFNGYCAFGDCTPGVPLPPPSPCWIPTIAHSWTAAGGWVNAGSVDRLLDAGTGRYYGGTRCDGNVNSANDISGNGRYIVGGAWTTGLTRFDGGPSYGLCGDFAAFIADRTTGDMMSLPVGPGVTTARADRVNDDGSVITGYDLGEIIDPEFGAYEGRRASVWTNGVQTILNTVSSVFDTFPVNGAGTVLAIGTDPTFNNATFEINDMQVVRWVRQPNDSWIPEALGRVADYFDGVEVKPLVGMTVVAVSDDGNTIVGNATFATSFWDRINRGFIWNPSINGGVPMELGAYIASIAPGSPIVQTGFGLTAVRGLSADGNAISVSVEDARTTCDPQDLGLFTGNHGILYLDGSGISCDEPRLAMQPRGNISTQYTPFGVALNVFASGTWPMTYAWQREDPQNPGQWLDLTESCSGFPYGGEWDYEGVAKNQLRIGQATCGNNRDGRYRVIVSNSCGTVTSEPATVSFQQGTLITQQPVNAVGCSGGFVFFNAVAVSNSAELTNFWEIADASDPLNFVQIFDGQGTLPDGRPVNVFGSEGQFLGLTLGRSVSPGSYLLRTQFVSPCGGTTSNTVTLTVCPADFSCDGFVDGFDYDGFVAAFEEGTGPDGLDADFNGDGFVDGFDYDDFVTAFEAGC